MLMDHHEVDFFTVTWRFVNEKSFAFNVSVRLVLRRPLVRRLADDEQSVYVATAVNIFLLLVI